VQVQIVLVFARSKCDLLIWLQAMLFARGPVPGNCLFDKSIVRADLSDAGSSGNVSFQAENAHAAKLRLYSPTASGIYSVFSLRAEGFRSCDREVRRILAA
jgi:hypothetical protein